MQKYGLQANRYADPKFVCVICCENAGFNWSDLHGEGMCNRCGTPYLLTETPHTLQIRQEWVPVLRHYWQEERKYMGLGEIVIWRDYPEAKAGRVAFYEWLDQHPELVSELRPAQGE